MVTTASVVGPAPPLEEAYTVQEYSVDGSRWLSVKVRVGLSWALTLIIPATEQDTV